MGWASGTYVMGDIIDGLFEDIKDGEVRKQVYKSIIRALETADWDTQDECMGQDSAFDEALAELHPEWEDLD